MAMLAILILPLSMLGFTAVVGRCCRSACRAFRMPGRTASARCSISTRRSTGNNGSAFAGFTGNTPWYNTTGGLAMLIGRYFVIVPMMAVAGSLVVKKTVPASAGTFPTHGATVRRPSRRRDPDRRRPDVLPGARARTDRRASRDARQHPVLTGFSSEPKSMETSKLRKRMPVSTILDPKIILPAIGASFRKLDPAALARNPVMFVARGGRRA